MSKAQTAAAQATAPAAAERSRASGRDAQHSRAVRKLVLLAVLVLVPLSVFMLPVTILLAAGLLPTAVAFITDRDPDKLAALTVGPLNIAGMTPLALSLSSMTGDYRGSMDLLAHPINWMVIYLAAGMGWAVYFAVPPVVARLLSLQSEARIVLLKRRLTGLVAEWGPAVTRQPHGLSAVNEDDAEAAEAKPAAA